MEQTFMTIHNLSPDANILFASDSIFDILGYQQHEVQNQPCFEFFHPDEVPFARSVHSRGVELDKAAVLHYARIRSRDGPWISCECCFTIVHDVLVACTSIYRKGEKSERRAIEAPQIRRIFSCSPRDPRYHMLEHLSPKFRMPAMEREPRAALILNRFTVTLTVMFATNAVASILGVGADQIKGKSFYECIQENCLPEAIRCLESAKANDSIAYLRFWYRDPRRDEDFEAQADEETEGGAVDSDIGGSGDSEGGGAQLDTRMDLVDDNLHIKAEVNSDAHHRDASSLGSSSNTANASQFHSGSNSGQYQNLASALSHRSSSSRSSLPGRRRAEPIPSFELESVVSCTSDGLVVVLRRARPPMPAPHPPILSPLNYENGLFAAPWGQQPIRPHDLSSPYPESFYSFRPPLLPQHIPLRQDAVRQAEAGGVGTGGPPADQLMRSIRDVAVFAWGLIGINGNLAACSRSLPRDGAQPPDGLPIWDPDAGSQLSYLGPENQAARRRAQQGDAGSSNTPAKSTASYSLADYDSSSQQAHNQQLQGFGLYGQGSGVGDNYTHFQSSSNTSLWPEHKEKRRVVGSGGSSSIAPCRYVLDAGYGGYPHEQRLQTSNFAVGAAGFPPQQGAFGKEQERRRPWGEISPQYSSYPGSRHPWQ